VGHGRAPNPLEAVAILGIDETIGVERVAIEERGVNP